jgi:hypothetical protein
LLVVARSEGCSKRTAVRRHVGDRTEERSIGLECGRPNYVVPELEAILGKTHRTAFEGGGWKCGRWSDEAPAPQSKARRTETSGLRLRAPVLYPTRAMRRQRRRLA